MRLRLTSRTRATTTDDLERAAAAAVAGRLAILMLEADRMSRRNVPVLSDPAKAVSPP